MPFGSQSASALDRLVDRLSRLPGIGRRSAQRVAFYLLKQPAEEAFALAEAVWEAVVEVPAADEDQVLAEAVRDFKKDLKVCRACGNISESDPCPICADPKRDHGLILVVEQPSDIAQFEALGTYSAAHTISTESGESKSEVLIR